MAANNTHGASLLFCFFKYQLLKLLLFNGSMRLLLCVGGEYCYVLSRLLCLMLVYRWLGLGIVFDFVHLSYPVYKTLFPCVKWSKYFESLVMWQLIEKITVCPSLLFLYIYVDKNEQALRLWVFQYFFFNISHNSLSIRFYDYII